jgi:hypothetical protein
MTLDGLEYVDNTVAPGVGYYYRLVAYDTGSENWADPGVSLESGHFYCWTGWGLSPVSSVAKAAEVLEDNIRVVPNPYNKRGQTFPGEVDKILFKNLPLECTIRIYTVAGDLVKKIDHSGSGDEPWDMKTDYNQYVKSGLFLYAVDSDIGSEVGKFIIIR